MLFIEFKLIFEESVLCNFVISSLRKMEPLELRLRILTLDYSRTRQQLNVVVGIPLISCQEFLLFFIFFGGRNFYLSLAVNEFPIMWREDMFVNLFRVVKSNLYETEVYCRL